MTVGAGSVVLEIPPRSDHLALVRRVLGAAAALAPELSARRVDDLRLAVTEACANAIDGQRANGSERPVLVRIEVTETAVAVTVTDHGGGFDPGDVDPLPDADDPRRLGHERGLGLPLMRGLTDRLAFTRTEEGTSVRLEVQIR